MDEVLVEDAEHDVDHEDREREQQAHALLRSGKRLRRAHETVTDRRRQLALRDLRDRRVGLAERNTRLQIVRDRDGGHLADVRHRERAHPAAQRRHRIERHELPGLAADAHERERRGLALVLRRHLHDHVVLVRRRVDGGDLPGAKGVVEGILDLLRRHAEGRRTIALDFHPHLRTGDLHVGVDVHQLRQRGQFRLHRRGHAVELVHVGAEEGKLVQRARLHAADADRGRLLRVGADARHHGEIAPQVGDDLGRRDALAARLEAERHAPAGAVGGGHERLDRRVLRDDRSGGLLVAHHLLKRNILRSL